MLLVEKSGSDTVLSWNSLHGAGRYDVVRGSLETLRTTGGDYALATEGCPANNQLGTSLVFSGAPEAGEGFWSLVRAVNCGGNGTYNSGGPGQVGDRDAEINASGGACP